MKVLMCSGFPTYVPSICYMSVCVSVSSSGGTQFKTSAVPLSWRHRAPRENQNVLRRCWATVHHQWSLLHEESWVFMNLCVCRLFPGRPGGDWGALLWDGFTPTGGHGGVRHIFSHQQRCAYGHPVLPPSQIIVVFAHKAHPADPLTALFTDL